MTVLRVNWVLAAIPGCLPKVGYPRLRGGLNFDLVSLNPGQFQEVPGVSALTAPKGK